MGFRAAPHGNNNTTYSSNIDGSKKCTIRKIESFLLKEKDKEIERGRWAAPGDLETGNRTVGIFSAELCARGASERTKSAVPSRDTQIAEKSLPSSPPLPSHLPVSRVSSESQLAAAAAAPPQSEEHSVQLRSGLTETAVIRILAIFMYLYEVQRRERYLFLLLKD